MPTLTQRLAGKAQILAPLVLNRLMARLVEAAGFETPCLGGGASGYANAYLEANLTSTGMVAAGVQIRCASTLPFILDAAGGRRIAG